MRIDLDAAALRTCNLAPASAFEGSDHEAVAAIATPVPDATGITGLVGKLKLDRIAHTIGNSNRYFQRTAESDEGAEHAIRGLD
jgi:hypothetical protein